MADKRRKKRDRELRMKVTSEELRAFQEAAERCGAVGTSSWARMILRERVGLNVVEGR